MPGAFPVFFQGELFQIEWDAEEDLVLFWTPELPELTANLQQPEIRAPSFDGSRIRRSAVHFGQSSPIEPEARVATTTRGRAVS